MRAMLRTKIKGEPVVLTDRLYRLLDASIVSPRVAGPVRFSPRLRLHFRTLADDKQVLEVELSKEEAQALINAITLSGITARD